MFLEPWLSIQENKILEASLYLYGRSKVQVGFVTILKKGVIGAVVVVGLPYYMPLVILVCIGSTPGWNPSQSDLLLHVVK